MREAILLGWITTGSRTKKQEKQIPEFVHTDKTAMLYSSKDFRNQRVKTKMNIFDIV